MPSVFWTYDEVFYDMIYVHKFLHDSYNGIDIEESDSFFQWVVQLAMLGFLQPVVECYKYIFFKWKFWFWIPQNKTIVKQIMVKL